MEQRLGEVLPPGPGMAQGLGQVEVELLHRQAAVGQQPTGQVLFAQLASHFFVERLGKCREIGLGQRQPRRHRVAAELADQLRVARRHGIQRIANMEPRHRTRRPFEHALASVGESDGRPVVTLLQARSQNTDNPLVPVGIEQAQAIWHRLDRQVLELGQGLALHALFDRLAVLVQVVQLLGHVLGQGRVFTQQAFDAQAHVVQAPGSVQPRA
ncbi:hypothetical protein D3C72_1265010 [compost metagenome]